MCALAHAPRTHTHKHSYKLPFTKDLKNVAMWISLADPKSLNNMDTEHLLSILCFTVIFLASEVWFNVIKAGGEVLLIPSDYQPKWRDLINSPDGYPLATSNVSR